MKQATVLACERTVGRAYLVAHIHDEMQFECPEAEAQAIASELSDSIVQSGVILSLRIPMAGDAKVGKSWADTH